MLVMAILVLRRHVRVQLPDDDGADGDEVYGKGAGEYGMLGSILAIGSLAGALIAARRTSSSQRLVVVSGDRVRAGRRSPPG